MAACLFVVLIVTSQQPQQQTDTWGEIKRRVGDIAWYEAETRAKTTASMGKVFSPGGGFGPVDEDGYGVRCVCVCLCVCTWWPSILTHTPPRCAWCSYMVAGEDLIYFHISSKRASPASNGQRFKQEILKAFADMRDLFATS